MLKMNIIQESRSPYSSPIVIVKKWDSTNKLLISQSSTRQQKLIQNQQIQLQRQSRTLALTCGFQRSICPAKENDHKTAFSSPDESYEFLRMPFGVVNSGATLMRAMRILLEGMENVKHVVNDILIHNVTWKEHLGTLLELLRRMSGAGLTARPSKTVIDFVGYKVGHGVSSLIEENLQKI